MRSKALSLLCSLLLVGALPAQTLKERIAARRAVAAARAGQTLADRLAAQAVEAVVDVPFDPLTSPDAWRIHDYEVPGRNTFGSFDRGGYEGRVYAEAPAGSGSGVSEGTPVAFYELTKRENEFRLMGRGVVRKVRSKQGMMSVEAALLACTECVREANILAPTVWKTEGLIQGYGPSFQPKVVTLLKNVGQMNHVSVMKLRRGAHPKRRRYFMSIKPLGPYRELGQEKFQHFVRGQAWKGMAVTTLIAMMGVPHQGKSLEDGERYQWGLGHGLKQFDTQNGRVVSMDLGLYSVADK